MCAGGGGQRGMMSRRGTRATHGGNSGVVEHRGGRGTPGDAQVQASGRRERGRRVRRLDGLSARGAVVQWCNDEGVVGLLGSSEVWERWSCRCRVGKAARGNPVRPAQAPQVWNRDTARRGVDACHPHPARVGQVRGGWGEAAARTTGVLARRACPRLTLCRAVSRGGRRPEPRGAQRGAANGGATRAGAASGVSASDSTIAGAKKTPIQQGRGRGRVAPGAASGAGLTPAVPKTAATVLPPGPVSRRGRGVGPPRGSEMATRECCQRERLSRPPSDRVGGPAMRQPGPGRALLPRPRFSYPNVQVTLRKRRGGRDAQPATFPLAERPRSGAAGKGVLIGWHGGLLTKQIPGVINQ